MTLEELAKRVHSLEVVMKSYQEAVDALQDARHAEMKRRLREVEERVMGVLCVSRREHG